MERKLLKSCCEKCGKETNVLYESFIKNFKFLCKDCSFIEMLYIIDEQKIRLAKLREEIEKFKKLMKKSRH